MRLVWISLPFKKVKKCKNSIRNSKISAHFMTKNLLKCSNSSEMNNRKRYVYFYVLF